MEYTALENQKYYTECQKMVDGISYTIVELHVVPAKNTIKVSIVICHKDSSLGVGINDCAKVHRLLLPHFEDVLQSEDVYMEVTSPGMERTLKNAAEFPLFLGRNVKVWHTELSDWIQGTILKADEKAVLMSIREDNNEKMFPYGTIAKAKLLVEG